MKNRRRRLLQSNNEDSAQTGVVPSYVINDINQVCNQCVSGQVGLVQYQGITGFAGYLDLNGNSFTAVDGTGVTTQTGLFSARNNQIASVSFPNLVTGGRIDLVNNPITSVNFSSLVTLANGHIYLSYNPVITALSFPALTTMNYALVCSRDTGLLSVSLPNLTTLNHELEFDYCRNLAGLSLPSLTTLTGTVAGPNIVLAGDMGEIGQAGYAVLSSLSTPLLSAVNDGFIQAKGCRSLTAYDISSWTTIANGFGLNMSRSNISQASMDAIFIKLAAILGSVTVGTVDFRFQYGGQIPSASGQAAAATLVAAGIRNSQGGTTLYA